MVDNGTISHTICTNYLESSPFSKKQTSYTLSIVKEEDCNHYHIEIDGTIFFASLARLYSPLSILAPQKGRKYFVKWFVNHELKLFSSKEKREKYKMSKCQHETFIPFSETCFLPIENGKSTSNPLLSMSELGKSSCQLKKDDFFETIEEIGSGKVEIYNKVVTLPFHYLDIIVSLNKRIPVHTDVVNSLREFSIDILDGQSVQVSFERSGFGDLYRKLF